MLLKFNDVVVYDGGMFKYLYAIHGDGDIMKQEIYKDMKTRNKRSTELRNAGQINVKKTSQRGIILHPEYIKDWPYNYETGFGNTDYKQMHGVLYFVSWGEF